MGRWKCNLVTATEIWKCHQRHVARTHTHIISVHLRAKPNLSVVWSSLLQMACVSGLSVLQGFRSVSLRDQWNVLQWKQEWNTNPCTHNCQIWRLIYSSHRLVMLICFSASIRPVLGWNTEVENIYEAVQVDSHTYIIQKRSAFGLGHADADMWQTW